MGNSSKDMYGFILLDNSKEHYSKIAAVSKLLMDKINGNEIYEISKEDVDELAAEIVYELLICGGKDA